MSYPLSDLEVALHEHSAIVQMALLSLAWHGAPVSEASLLALELDSAPPPPPDDEFSLLIAAMCGEPAQTLKRAGIDPGQIALEVALRAVALGAGPAADAGEVSRAASACQRLAVWVSLHSRSPTGDPANGASRRASATSQPHPWVNPYSDRLSGGRPMRDLAIARSRVGLQTWGVTDLPVYGEPMVQLRVTRETSLNDVDVLLVEAMSAPGAAPSAPLSLRLYLLNSQGDPEWDGFAELGVGPFVLLLPASLPKELVVLARRALPGEGAGS